ncbi:MULTISPECIES: DUF2878 family protein [Lactiplantibacillus]|jgi:hypothetical protein|uniref:Uncharacterized protein n=1 Tax=Lactiplantibacillus pentosus TaxID=1589 RepID=A0ABD7ISV8_LACPE|nr:MULTISPECIES: DUF2878 family protein [Lactiplantibacillus]MCM8607278.1 DUF2878 family protein [Lactiplantibacillus sp. B652]PRO83511.1 hypothetical protein C6Y10_11915 [Lactiplantibacillus pentosus]PRO96113.1 hypothetical protein C6Y08_01080 [Lactiplantibacillus pentosus]RMW49782.1 hypothetical protein D6U18_04985 [Lactiplantibacillus pentosus]USJ86644.1 DUF2878 family protein [Lactiplantibacillus pentosus]
MRREMINQLAYRTFYMMVCATGIAAIAIFVAHWWQVLVFGVVVGAAAVLLDTILEHFNVPDTNRQVPKIPTWLKLIQLLVLVLVAGVTTLFTIRAWWVAVLIGISAGILSLLIELLSRRLVTID